MLLIVVFAVALALALERLTAQRSLDRKSTRLNSSHS